MSLTLDATLQAALDGSFHKPVIKIVSTSSAADIPFDGNLFNLDTTTEGETGFKALTTGQLALTYVKGNDLRFIVSDTARTTWSDVLLFDGDAISVSVIDAAFAELASGNLGVVFITRLSTTYRLRYMIITPAGAVVTAATEIANTSSEIWDSPTLCAIETGFLLAYKRYTATGPVYSIYKRTCGATFTTWSAAAPITLTGLVDGQEKNHPALLAAASGRVYLFFDYVDEVLDDKTQANIYQIYSTDDGATWSAPSALTTYSGFTTSAVHPSVAERSNGDIALAFHEKRAVITLDTNTEGWDSDCLYDSPSFVHYDPASGKVFVVSTGFGNVPVCAVIVIDPATWTVEKAYTQSGSPGFNSYWSDPESPASDAAGGGGIHVDGQLIAISSVASNIVDARAILLIDHATETVREYWFDTNTTYGFQRNVVVPWTDNKTFVSQIKSVFVDAANSRLYMAFESNYGSTIGINIAYLDLTEAADTITGMYELHDLVSITAADLPYLPVSANGLFLRVYPDDDRIVLSCCTATNVMYGYVKVFMLSTGLETKSYDSATNAGFHTRGMRWPVMINNKIYGGISYTSENSQEERRGLMIVDILSDTIIYERPTYVSIDDYNILDFKIIESGGRIIMADFVYGVVFYDVTAHTWTLYDGNNVPGFPHGVGDYGTAKVAYDEANDYVFTMDQNSLGTSPYPLAAFVEGGLFYLGKYMIGTLSGADYSFGDIESLTLYSGVRDLSIVYDENDIIWATWTKLDYSDNEESIQWDRDAFSPDLHDYMVAGSPAKITWEIGKISQAEFTLSRGDLFDPANLASIYAPVLAKGRIVEIWLGEKVSGVDCWQSQGKRIVTGTAMDFRRTEHPTIAVTCEDPSVWWPEMVVTATPAYSDATLADAFADLMDIAQLEAGDYDTPSLTNAHNIYMQWVDESMQSIMDDICHHFGCFGHWQSTGKFTLRPINLAAAVSHTYSNRDKMIDWTADDRYGSFVNRVTVRCEGRDFLEVLWDEERVASKNGTVGFWTKDETFDVWFSDDRTRRCRYCRMEILQSVKEYSPYAAMLGGGGSEEIIYIDPNELYVTTEVEVPDRALYAFAFAATFVGFSALAIACDSYLTKSGWCYIPIMGMSMSLGALVQVLTAVANYRYDYYARPVGHEKQMYQATVDDTTFQQQLGGKIIAHEMDDALSYTVEHCRMVAQHEIDVLSGQRNRVAFKKIAHLQDEIGDVIQVVHAVSGQSLNIFVARLQRTFNRSDGSGGEFSDRIDGWRII